MHSIFVMVGLLPQFVSQFMLYFQEKRRTTMIDFLLSCFLIFGAGLFIGLVGLAAYIFIQGLKDEDGY